MKEIKITDPTGQHPTKPGLRKVIPTGHFLLRERHLSWDRHLQICVKVNTGNVVTRTLGTCLVWKSLSGGLLFLRAGGGGITVSEGGAEGGGGGERLLFHANEQYCRYIMARTNYNQCNDDVHFVLEHHAEMDLHSGISLEQQSDGKHLAPLGHIILIPSQPIFALSP